MCIYNNKRVVESDEKKAMGVLLIAQSKGLSNCSMRMIKKVENAVVLLTSRGYLVDIC